mgnify:CR=1 FL=1
MPDTEQVLDEAFQLIEAEQYARARELIQPLLDAEPENPDVWWVYAHAVEDAQEGQAALDRVAALQSDYPGLEELRTPAAPQPARPLKKLSPKSPTQATTEAEQAPTAGSAQAGAAASERRGGTSRILLVAVLILVVVAGVLLVLSNQSEQTPPPTDVVQNPTATTDAAEKEANGDQEETEEPTATEEPTEEPTATEEPTEEPTATDATVVAEATSEVEATDDPEATQEAADTGPDYSDLIASLDDFDILPEPVNTETTALGNTLLVSACGVAGPAINNTVRGVLDVITTQLDGLPDDVLAVGVRIVDCDQDSTIRTIAVSRADAQAYADGDLSDGDFLRAWRPV